MLLRGGTSKNAAGWEASSGFAKIQESCFRQAVLEELEMWKELTQAHQLAHFTLASQNCQWLNTPDFFKTDRCSPKYCPTWCGQFYRTWVVFSFSLSSSLKTLQYSGIGASRVDFNLFTLWRVYSVPATWETRLKKTNPRECIWT